MASSAPRRAGGVRRLSVVLAVIAAVLMLPAAALAVTGPALLGSAANSTSLSGATSAAVSGQYAYTTAYWPGQLTVLDISNRAAPTVVGTTSPTPSLENGSNVTISGTDAFVVSKNRNASTTNNDDGSGNSLTVVDISNPTNPIVSGTVHDAAQLFGAYGVAVQGQFAYVASQGFLSGQPPGPQTSFGSFSVIDLATMTIVAHIENGTLPAKWQNALKHATSVAISGHYAYVTAFYDDRVTVLDISNPTSPVIVASLRDATNLAYPADLAVQGHYLYVANQVNFSNQFAVVDISNPANPVVVGSLNSSSLEGAYRIRVKGDFAYVSASSVSTVAAIDISNPVSPRLAGSVTDSAHLFTTTGLDLDGSGRYVIASSPLLSTDTGAKYPPFPGSGAPPNTGTISVIDMDPAAISVAIQPPSEPPNPTTQTSASFGFSVDDSVSVVQCGLDGASLGPCSTTTTQGYTGLPLGTHTFTVRATDAAGNTSTDTYTWTVGTVPQNTVPPAVTGTATQGQTLTAAPGTWSGVPAPTYAYQWLRCDAGGRGCAPIASATSATYVIGQADVGVTLAVAVTANNGLGSPASAQSTATAVVGAGSTAPSNSSLPAITGTATQGQTLTVTPGVWSGAPAPAVADQWRRCDVNGQGCAAIPGATSTTYLVQAADAGLTLDVLETATNAAGSASVPSLATAIVTSAPQNTTPPAITGTATQGQTLTAAPGTWSGVPAPTYAYQWQRCDPNGQNCAPVAAATSPSYSVQQADVGATLRALVTASSGAGSGLAPSAPTARVIGPPIAQAPPAIAGTPRPGSQLTGTPGAWSGYPAPSFTYRWQRCSSAGTGCRTREGQTASRYTVANADLGFTLRLVSTATNGSGSASATSAPTAVVSVGSTRGPTAIWHASLRGMVKRTANLRIAVAALRPPELVKSVSVSLPKGLRFSGTLRELARDITVRAPGSRRHAFSIAIRHGRLVLRLTKPMAGIQILISGRALAVSKSFAVAARRRGFATQVAVAIADEANRTTRIRLKLQPN